MPRYNNVRDLPSGRFQARFIGPDGRSHCKTFDTAREASEWRATQISDESAGRWVSPAGGKSLFRDWVVRYDARRVDIRPTTRARDDSLVRNHILPAFGVKAIGAIGQGDVSDWVAELVAKEL